MGCGESKHAVAIENTLTKSKNLENKSMKEEDNLQVSCNGNVEKNEIPEAKEAENSEPAKETQQKTEEKGKPEDTAAVAVAEETEAEIKNAAEDSDPAKETQQKTEEKGKPEDTAVVAVVERQAEIKKAESGAKEAAGECIISESVSPGLSEGRAEGDDAAAEKDDANKEKGKEEAEGNEVAPLPLRPATAEEIKPSVEENADPDQIERDDVAAPTTAAVTAN